MAHNALILSDQAWLVVASGGVAALQVGKPPPALPARQTELGLTLVQSGFLLSMVPLAGVSLAVIMGLWVDVMGVKRSMLRGLRLLAMASGLGAFATSAAALLALRATEGLGFLLGGAGATRMSSTFFYHLVLRCHVVIELKGGKFKPERLGSWVFI